MSLLNDAARAQLRKAFEELVHPVRLVVFSQALADPGSEEVARLIGEVAELDPRLAAESYNFVLERDKAVELGITRTPAVAVLGADKDYGIRFYGIPGGYEFGSLIHAVVDTSRRENVLTPATLDALAALEHPVHVQVFSTPT